MPFIPLLCAWIYNTVLAYGWKSDTFCIVWGEANARADALAEKNASEINTDKLRDV